MMEEIHAAHEVSDVKEADMKSDFETRTMLAYRQAEQKAKERRSLYKTLAVCAVVIVASKAVGNVIAPRSRVPYRSTF